MNLPLFTQALLAGLLDADQQQAPLAAVTDHLSFVYGVRPSSDASFAPRDEATQRWARPASRHRAAGGGLAGLLVGPGNHAAVDLPTRSALTKLCPYPSG